MAVDWFPRRPKKESAGVQQLAWLNRFHSEVTMMYSRVNTKAAKSVVIHELRTYMYNCNRIWLQTSYLLSQKLKCKLYKHFVDVISINADLQKK